MKYSVQLALGLALILVSAAEALSCSCADWSVREKFRRADAVFVARVVQLTPMKPTKDFPLAADLAKLEIEKRWKGRAESGETAIVDFDMPNFCGDLNLSAGERYLIYASRQKGKLLIQTDCGPNRQLKYAAKEIERLNSRWFRFVARLYPYPSI